MNATLSRRTFAQLLGTGAALALAPPLLAGNNLSEEKAQKHAAGAAESVIRLSSNENPYGPSPAALQAMTDAFKLAWRYPDEAADALIRDLARHHGIATNHFLLGDGSSEILKLAACAFLDAPRKLVTADPTFEALAIYTSVRGTEVVKVPLDASYGHDLSKMAAVDGAGLIYVCNPNNPTGSITPKAALRSFLEAAPAKTIVLVDEAYHHYATSSDYESVIPLVDSHPNLIVARTFSKIYGMAGLRLGYAVAKPPLVEKMVDQGAWDSVNIMALAAARASVGDTKHVDDGRKRNHDTKAGVIAELDRLGYKTIPSETNFIMVDIHRDVKPVIARLRENRVQVGRLFAAMPHHLRVTIGTPEQMTKFVGAFKEVMA
jgi:histidinol-phosphate aminotransferase